MEEKKKKVICGITVEDENDPFYSESNLRHLVRIMEDYEAGRLHFEEHELIEVDDDDDDEPDDMDSQTN